MSSTLGDQLKLSIFGQSHGPSIGMTLDGVPAGLAVNETELQHFLDRRAPGNAPWASTRKEPDQVHILSGIANGYTCGTPITAVIYNKDVRSTDYENILDCPRPGHADYTAKIKYGGRQDNSGGGHFSGRMTAPLCIAGGLCLQWLAQRGIHVGAHILSVSDIYDNGFDPLVPELSGVNKNFPVLNEAAGAQMIERIAQVKARGDSVGGQIECAITGLPAGLGDPMFDGVENRISRIVFGIPAIKGIQFGDTMDYGSENNDAFQVENGAVTTRTNHCGGILGGITNGMPLTFRVTIKPTPSIALPQQTIRLSTMEPITLQIKGRHDPCIVPRAVPAVEAAAAVAVFEMLLGNRAGGSHGA